jgi:hypothetical protein
MLKLVGLLLEGNGRQWNALAVWGSLRSGVPSHTSLASCPYMWEGNKNTPCLCFLMHCSCHLCPVEGSYGRLAGGE